VRHEVGQNHSREKTSNVVMPDQCVFLLYGILGYQPCPFAMDR
jgi:hypothetical protein